MNVLFVIPTDKKQRKNRIKPGPNTGINIPLGVAQIAAVLERVGYNVRVLDLRLSEINIFDKISDEVNEFNPDVIGFPISFFSAGSVFELAKFLKGNFNVPIIVGGPYASVFPTGILRENNSVDIVAVGEADYALLEILNCLKDNKSLGTVTGICYRDKKTRKIVKTGERLVVRYLDQLPFPAIHLFDSGKYTPHPKHYKRLPVLPMITGRGCPWAKCSFCYQPRKGIYRRQSPKRVVSEIKCFIQKYNIKEVRFWDDNFIWDERWVTKFCSLIKRENIKIGWSCHARVDMVNKDVLKRIAGAGCWQVFYGIESRNQELLDRINKGITLQQAGNAVRWTKEAGMEVRTSFMLGLPGETPEMADKTVDFALQLDSDITQFSLTTPYPGTQLYENYKDSGRLDKNMENYNENRVVYLPEGYKDKEELERKFRQAYRRCYFNPGYIMKNVKKIGRIEDIKRMYTGAMGALGTIYSKK